MSKKKGKLTSSHYIIPITILLFIGGFAIYHANDYILKKEKKAAVNRTGKKKIASRKTSDQKIKRVKRNLPSSKYLGEYNINVSGYRGILKLYTRKGQLHGAIRFSTWGKGVTEYLSNISINNSQISFTRSISTIKERKRTGASRFLHQQYFGKYSKTGRVIKGYYIDSGSENIWFATR